MRYLPALLAPIALVACQADEGAGEGQAAGGDVAEAPAAAASAAAAPVGIEAPAARGVVTLRSEGLQVGPDGGTAIDFYTPRATVEQRVRAILGEATDRASNQECGSGPMQFAEWGSLTLAFDSEGFVGWMLHEGSDIATTDGIRTGITRADLARERQVVDEVDSTLENEFHYVAADGSAMYGFFSGTGPGARVTDLYAGNNCFFR